MDPATLPKDADNYDVWCDRCQKMHKYYTYTQEDHARVIDQAVKNLSDEIDKRVALEIAAIYGLPEVDLKPPR